jgi:Protein of unknown function (DUF2842)
VIANPPPEPSWRKPAGMLLILLLIMVWASLVVAAADTIGGWHIAVQTIVYMVAGTVWILPLKPLLQWMETGTWRAP